ncbi:glycosyltransferase [Roseimicrobium sp. ORNL1]|uniref:glycosyltransferase n=1 Tax=Roseimicrobium sp. ORNL1 TaxID=2711231 RepID=UPI0013E1038C|nr:glycosyltransferase [Roseimicrobium sp. ORNL1]QIF04478.1 glycosyltransferase family 2 protein [Roseimicrobium sp. ORNL1]
MLISVIICTRNPRSDYLSRVLEGLRRQTLELNQWELVLVDNDSDEPLAGKIDLSWHPLSRCVREEMRGHVPARLKGIESSAGDFLIFVDDDNVLHDDYLEQALEIGAKWPMLGTWGASITGEFEVPPPTCLEPYIDGLAICELDQAYWSNIPVWTRATPYGAGVCVRKEVAASYLHAARETPLRRSLGRSGANLGAGDDSDLSWTSTRLNLGFGRFPELKLTHLISARRLTTEYMTSLFAGFVGSGIILDHLWGRPVKEPPLVMQVLSLVKALLRGDKIQRMIAWRSFSSKRQAWQLLKTNAGSDAPRGGPALKATI